MSRKEEKAMGMLNRWSAYKDELRVGHGRQANRRPALARDCTNLHEAMGFRRDLVRDISDKVSEIQNAALGEYRLRELNDEINKMLRVKHHWDVQVEKLGGPTLRDTSEDRSKYKYFGAARELPQVRELLAKPPPKPTTRRKREDIAKNISYTYYESASGPAARALEEAERQLEHELEVAANETQTALPAVAAKPPLVPVSEFEQLLMRTEDYSLKPFLTPAQQEELDTAKAAERIVVERKKKELAAKYLM